MITKVQKPFFISDRYKLVRNKEFLDGLGGKMPL